MCIVYVRAPGAVILPERLAACQAELKEGGSPFRALRSVQAVAGRLRKEHSLASARRRAPRCSSSQRAGLARCATQKPQTREALNAGGSRAKAAGGA